MIPIHELQQDVLDFLEKVSAFIRYAGNILSSGDVASDSRDRYADFTNQIISETMKVRNLKLRLAVVAPMKAGKSTIINAIAGQEILPSRNTAMTALPTEIIFCQDTQKPTLELSDDTVSVFEETIEKLKRRLVEIQENEEMIEALEQAEYLKRLAKQILDNYTGFPLQRAITGQENVCHALEFLNDLIRLWAIVAVEADTLQRFNDIPHIKTPVLHLSNSDMSDMVGNLVIIDTPGINEFGNLNLSGVVQEQLETSSIVLLVLDFTQLNTEAAEHVRQKVHRIIKQRGKESLYVLVNKIDQRRNNDMSTDDVKQFVTSQFNIDRYSSEAERIFEVAARKASSATNFLLEHEEFPCLDVPEMKAAKPLAQEAWGDLWEELFDRCDIDELRRGAIAIWKRSGFEGFLENTIYALMLQVAPQSMKSALNITKSHLISVADDIKIRKNALEIDQENLQNQLDDLKKDLQQLQSFHIPWETEVMQRKDALQCELERQVKRFRTKSVIHFNATDNTPDTQFLKQLCEKFRIPHSTRSFQFGRKTDAETFSSHVLNHFEQKTEENVQDLRIIIDRHIQTTNMEIRKFFDGKIEPIVQQAQKRLERVFQLDIKLSPPEWPTENIGVNIDIKEDSKKSHVLRWYKVKWLPFRIPFWISINRNFYVISLEKVLKQINESIILNFDNIGVSLQKYIDEDFQGRVRYFFDSVDNYFNVYRKSLERALRDHKMEEEKKKQLCRELENLLPQVENLLEDSNQYLENVMNIVRHEYE